MAQSIWSLHVPGFQFFNPVKSFTCFLFESAYIRARINPDSLIRPGKLKKAISIYES